MDCQNIIFSQKQSQKRIEKALQIIPSSALKKIFFFPLYSWSKAKRDSSSH